MRSLRLHVGSVALLLIVPAACSIDGDLADKGAEEDPFVDDGKDDSFRTPTDNGEVSFAEPAQAAFTDDELYHSWTFTLTGEAKISLQTTIDEELQNPDTVMYLYRRDPGATLWGHYIKKNDDHDDTLASRIERNAKAGEYRIKVKAYKKAMRGAFGLEAACQGDGCPGAASGPTIADLIAVEEFSAADFDCDSDATAAFTADPDYLFFTADGDSAIVDFEFRRETTPFATSVVATAQGLGFESDTLESQTTPGRTLRIRGEIVALDPSELIEADQPPIGINVTYEYRDNGALLENCTVPLISGLRF